MNSNGIRPGHMIAGAVVFAAGLFMALGNLVYVVDFIKGVAQPVLILLGLTALASAILRNSPPFRQINLAVGIAALGIGLFGVYDEYTATVDVVVGALPLLLLAGGLIMLLHGIRQVLTIRQVPTRDKGEIHGDDA